MPNNILVVKRGIGVGRQPTYELDIDGDINASGVFRTDDHIVLETLGGVTRFKANTGFLFNSNSIDIGELTTSGYLQVDGTLASGRHGGVRGAVNLIGTSHSGYMKLETDNNGMTINVGSSGSGAYLRLGVSSEVNQIYCNYDGNVGIGTGSPTPGYKLDISGNLKCSGIIDSGNVTCSRIGVGTGTDGFFELNVLGNTKLVNNSTSACLVIDNSASTNMAISITSGASGFDILSTNWSMNVNGNLICKGIDSNYVYIHQTGVAKILLQSGHGSATEIHLDDSGGETWLIATFHAADKFYITKVGAARAVIEMLPDATNDKLYFPQLTNAVGIPLVVDTSDSNKVYYNASSARFKHDIVQHEADFEKILTIDAKQWLTKEQNMEDVGFVAEDFDEAGLKSLVIYNKEGECVAVRANAISAYLLEVIKKQRSEIEGLKSSVAEIEKKIN